MSKQHSNHTQDQAEITQPITPEDESIAKKPTISHLLKFTLPTMLSMLVMGTMGIVDGIFVSRHVSHVALAAVGLVWPFISFVMAFGFMMGVGGNALVAKKIGEGQEKQGRENFSLISLISFIVSVALSLVGIFFPDFIFNILGVDYFAREMANDYMRPMLFFIPAITLGVIFNQFLITVGKAHYSAIVTFVGGLLSAGLNYVLIVRMDMGITGASIASSMGFALPFIVGLLYFLFNRKNTVYFVLPKWDFMALVHSAINGSSEMVTMLATSITATRMNHVLMGLADGGMYAIAASSIVFGGMGIFSALYVGYASGMAPIVSYNYGNKNSAYLKLLFKNSMGIITVTSIMAVGLTFLLMQPLLWIYDVDAYSPVYNMARNGLMFLSIGFVFMGFNFFASMLFTALNNGVVSSVLSIFRTLIFVLIAFEVLPRMWGLTGAWLSMPMAEIFGIAITIFFLVKMRKKYDYA